MNALRAFLVLYAAVTLGFLTGYVWDSPGVPIEIRHTLAATSVGLWLLVVWVVGGLK